MDVTHYAYILVTIGIIIMLMLQKDITLLCVFGGLLLIHTYTHSITQTILLYNKAIINSALELIGIIIVIAIVSAMSRAMNESQTDKVLIAPLKSLMKTPSHAFLCIVFTMFALSLLLWPSPAMSLVGALLVPAAAATGLPIMQAAIAMNIAGHGIGLSGDFIIQGAPNLTAKSAGIEIGALNHSLYILWIVMSLSVLIISYINFKRSLKDVPASNLRRYTYTKPEPKVALRTYTAKINRNKRATFSAVMIILIFTFMLLAIFKLNLTGSNATAIVTIVSLLITAMICFVKFDFNTALVKFADYIKYGFTFSIQIFAPIILIATFFFLGSQNFAIKVFGETAPGILNNLGMSIMNYIPVTKVTVVMTIIFIAIITGLDGSGFAGLPLVGVMAQMLGSVSGYDTSVLAALGQIVIIWVGSGTIIPWSVAPVAAICHVSPTELARMNLKPVLFGIFLTGIAAVLIL